MVAGARRVRYDGLLEAGARYCTREYISVLNRLRTIFQKVGASMFDRFLRKKLASFTSRKKNAEPEKSWGQFTYFLAGSSANTTAGVSPQKASNSDCGTLRA